MRKSRAEQDCLRGVPSSTSTVGNAVPGVPSSWPTSGPIAVPTPTAPQPPDTPKLESDTATIEAQELEYQSMSGFTNAKPQASPPLISSSHHPLISAHFAPTVPGVVPSRPSVENESESTNAPASSTIERHGVNLPSSIHESSFTNHQSTSPPQTLNPSLTPEQADTRIRELENRVIALIAAIDNRDAAAEAAAQAEESAEPDPNLADRIVELALTEFRIGRTPTDEAFAVPRVGPNIAHMLRGGSAPLRKALAREFHRLYGRTLNSSALSDALTVIEAETADLEPEPVALRVASLPSGIPCATGGARAPLPIEEQEQARSEASPHASPETRNTNHETQSRDLASPTEPKQVASCVTNLPSSVHESSFTNHKSASLVIDLGRPDGQTVIVTPDGWHVAARSPVLFRRTPLTGRLPPPVAGGRLEQLRSLINVSDDGFQMLRGWLVAGFFPSLAHPILALRGEQGTGKSTALRMLAGLVDPSAALALSVPSDSENWITMADGGWCLPLDNVAGIAPWFSEALCRAVTGEGVVRRRLYTDGDFAVIAFRRLIALTTINLGRVAADLADRLLPVDLELIEKSSRLPESRLLARYEALQPQIFGALLDDVAAVLRNLPHVRLAELPRMADFARLLSALPIGRRVANLPSSIHESSITNQESSSPPRTLNSALSIYLKLIDGLAVEIIDDDPLATALLDFMSTRDSWRGKATELLSLLPRPEESHGWPKTGQYLTVRLNEIASSLRTMGIAVDYTRAADYMRSRQIVLKSIGAV